MEKTIKGIPISDMLIIHDTTPGSISILILIGIIAVVVVLYYIVINKVDESEKSKSCIKKRKSDNFPKPGYTQDEYYTDKELREAMETQQILSKRH